MKKLADIAATAERLGIARITLYKMVSAKRIPFVKVGRRTLFDPEVVDNWIEAHSVPPLR